MVITLFTLDAAGELDERYIVDDTKELPTKGVDGMLLVGSLRMDTVLLDVPQLNWVKVPPRPLNTYGAHEGCDAVLLSVRQQL